MLTSARALTDVDIVWHGRVCDFGFRAAFARGALQAVNQSLVGVCDGAIGLLSLNDAIIVLLPHKLITLTVKLSDVGRVL